MMPRFNNFIPFVIILFLGVLLGSQYLNNNSKLIGTSFSQYKEITSTSNKPVLLHVFATWCRTCKHDLAVLQDSEIQKKYEIVGLLWHDSPNNLKNFLEHNPDLYSRVVVNGSKLAFDLGIIGVPETFIFDKHGTLLYNHVGTISKNKILDVTP